MSKEIDIFGPSAADGAGAPILSREEWRAVEVALRDAERFPTAAEAAGEGRLRRSWRWLTGIEPPRRLADPRLDAIRRFVWAARRHGARAMEMRPELCSLGLSARQVEMLARVAT